MARSAASHFVQGAIRGTRGTGTLSVYVEDGCVFADFAGVLIKMKPSQAKWLSGELQIKALMAEGGKG